MELPLGFKFGEVHKNEIPNMFSVWNDAFVNYELWNVIFKKSDPVQILPWLVKTFGRRWEMDDITMWKVTEVSSGWVGFHVGDVLKIGRLTRSAEKLWRGLG